jgi:outer membrane protein TolC
MERRREELRTAALGVSLSYHDFEPQLAGVISAFHDEKAQVYENGRYMDRQTGAEQSVGVSQKLPTGGSVAVSAGGVYGQGPVADDSWNYVPRVGITLVQPLLRGAGSAYTYEKLTQGKRSLVYGLRGFKLQRENLAIDVSEEFLNICDLKRKLDAARKNVERYEKLYRQSEAFRDTGRETELEFLRVKQEKLLAVDDELNRETDFATRLESFKLMLNLPIGSKIDLVDSIPPYDKLGIEADDAVHSALANRVDLRTATEMVEDNRRQERLAKSDMLPDLSIVLGAGASSPDAHLSPSTRSEDYSAGITLSLPLDRTQERFKLYSAAQQTIRGRRELELAKEAIEIGIRNSIKRIQRLEASIELANFLVESEQHRHDLALYRFQIGDISNRDVIDANNALQAALNHRIDLLTEHYIAMLRLQRDMGILDIDTLFLSAGK